MAKIVNIKKYQRHEKVDKILLYCADNAFETRYITAEFEKQSLLIKFTYFCHFEEMGTDTNIVHKFSPKNTRAFIKLLAKNKSDFLIKLQEKFNTASAFWDIVGFVNYCKIEFKSEFEPFFYNFGDIYETIPRLYYKDGSLIIPALYKHPKNGVVKIYLPSGDLYMEISYKNNLKNGVNKSYYENSKQIHWEQNYTKDKLDGITKNYYKDGKIKKEETFVNGVKEGWENYYNEEEGYLEQKQMYVNNVEHGPAFKYYPNGQIKHEAYFKNGKQDGVTKEYYESGKLKHEGKYKNDKPVGWGISYYENGNVMWKSPHGKTKGNETKYYENGNIEFTIESIGEKRNGKYTDYYEDGKVKKEGFYKNNKRDGQIICYYKNGKIKAEYQRKNGKLFGIAKKYYPNGKLCKEYIYANDKENGIQKYFYKSGALKYEHSYKNGLRDGYSIGYEEKTGEIKYKILFRKGQLIDYCNNDGITGVKNLKIKENDKTKK